MSQLQSSTCSNDKRLRPPTPLTSLTKLNASCLFNPLAKQLLAQQDHRHQQPPSLEEHSAITARRHLTSQRVKMQRLKQLQSQERCKERRKLSDEYLLSDEDEDLYAARLKYLHERRPSSGKKSAVIKLPRLFNFANSDAEKSQKLILTYNKETQSPTCDLQNLVLVLTREELRKEGGEVSSVIGGQKHLDVNMRIHSFIANTQDLIGCERLIMLNEAVSVIDHSIETNDKSWVVPGCGAELNIPTSMEDILLMSVPPDKPEISKSQVATEYIQAQRGFSDVDETVHLFQSDMLKADVAATKPPQVFERIVECLQAVVQKIIEIEYIEKKPETVQAVETLIEQMKSSNETVVQSVMREDFDEAAVMGKVLARLLIDSIMTELHKNHKERSFEPLRVLVSAIKQ